MWPWPEAATLGIQKPRGFEFVESKSVPDWTRAGVVVRLPISYQRAPFRPPLELATPELLTWMLWAVHREVVPSILLRCTAAAKSRVPRASRFLLKVFHLCACEMGALVAGTVSARFPEIVGV